MATMMLRLLANFYGYLVVYVLIASLLGVLGAMYLPLRLPFDTDRGLLILSAFCLAPIAGKYSFWLATSSEGGIARRLDRVDTVVIAFAIFGFYLTLAAFLRIFGFVSLPLGTLDIVVFSTLVAIYIPTLTLYVIRQKKRTLTKPKF